MPLTERARGSARYRFGFVLTTAAGNRTRYINLRKYAERDPDVECVWAPISHYIEGAGGGRFSRAPGPLRSRLIVAAQARPVMQRIREMDAIMFHAFEPYAWTALRSLCHRRPAIVWSQDNPPLTSPLTHPQSHYGPGHERPAWRRRLRLAFDTWCARRTALFLPFSHWAAQVLIGDCGVPARKVEPIHVGLDLEFWPHVPKPQEPDTAAGRSLSILFVGGDFERKGGKLMLDLFASELVGKADLTLVTNGAPSQLPAGVTVHSGLQPGDPLLRRLYAECDLFVLPTLADMSSWAALEAMATGRPVVISGVGGIPELVEEGITGFLVPPGDRGMLSQHIRTLMGDSTLRHDMGRAGRKRVETHFDAQSSVAAILGHMKRTVDETRALENR
jgi:glycosyltransferase involved in cell wall biosynthesis